MLSATIFKSIFDFRIFIPNMHAIFFPQAYVVLCRKEVIDVSTKIKYRFVTIILHLSKNMSVNFFFSESSIALKVRNVTLYLA